MPFRENQSAVGHSDSASGHSASSDSSDSGESNAQRLSREGNLVVEVGRGVINRVDELTDHPGQVAAELGGSMLIGAGLALAQGKAGVAREVAQIVGASMTASFVLTSARQFEVARDAVADTWTNKSGENREARSNANALGAFIADSAIFSAGGIVGVKVARNSSVYMGVHHSIDKALGIRTQEQHAQLRQQMLGYHPLTAHHQDRVGDMSRIIAEGMRLPPASVEKAYLAGRMHDIGKLKTPKEILDSPGKLDGHERAVINHHATDTGVILREKVDYPKRLADLPTVAQNHHERLDGRGSPSQLSAEQIAVETRVNTVADVFDVLSHGRSYKTPTPVSKLIDVFDRGRGTQFDGKVLDAFLQQPASKVLPLMLSEGGSISRVAPTFRKVEIGDLLRSVKDHKPVPGSSVTTEQINLFNTLYMRPQS